MARVRNETLQEKAERERVKGNVWRKTLITAAIVAVLIFLPFAVAGHYWAVVGVLIAVGAASGIIPCVAIFFYFSEKSQSKRRLTEFAAAENKRLEETEQAFRAQQELARKEAAGAAAQMEEDLLREHKRRDNREFILKKLSIVNTYIDLYDPSNFESARVRQDISRELADIMVNQSSHAELATTIAQEPDVRGMVISLRDRLQAKGINSAEASQIFAALQ